MITDWTKRDMLSFLSSKFDTLRISCPIPDFMRGMFSSISVDFEMCLIRKLRMMSQVWRMYFRSC